MNKLLAVFALHVLLSGFIPAERAYSAQLPLVINEFMASNSSSAQDPQGQYDDWIEIHNYGNDAIDIGGFYLTDNLSAPDKWRFPQNIPILTTIPPRGYLVIWADNDTEYSGLHTNFKLDAGGEEIALFDYDGSTLIDSVVFGEQTVDISYGRYPDAADNWQFFTSPSPSTENISVFQGFIEDVKFSHEHGFYDTSFSVTIATETKNAIIYYTLDGSEPFNTASAVRSPMGITYTGPVTINRTTCLRAVAIKSGWKSSDIQTQTYIFIDDVIRQSPTGQQPGPQWPKGSVKGQSIDYGMDPDVVNNAKYRGVIKDALLAIPSISLVTDLDNLFDSSNGIYVNARRDGIEWERPTSAELLNPDGSEGFQINAGLRIRGAFSRSGSNPKHALRLFFRNEYGAAKLRYPLFGSEGVDEFDKIDLRTSQNNSWAFQGSSQNTLIRDVFSRDVQRDMDQPYTRSRYYHLYINGHYWGIYQTQERADADFAESYLGGDNEQYDVIKNDSSGSRALHATDGTIDAYRRLYDAAVAGFDSDAAYYAVQGLRPDGSPDPAGEKLLDPENLMDYMICTYYTGDPDAPVSCWAHFSNNVFAIYNHVQPQGFTWYRHDAEHSLGANGGVNESRLLTDSTDRSIGEQWRHFNPAWLHVRLTEHPEYLTKFADRVNKYFFNDGILTAAQNIQRWNDRAEQIDLAIIAESARWGDAKTNTPFTKDHWEGQNNYMVNTFFPKRNQIVINKMRSVNMFPDFALVSFNRHGGQVLPGFKLNMSQSNGTSGTIYYTLDGSEPALQTVQQGTTTSTTLVTESASKRVLVPTRSIGSSWRGGGVFNDSSWILSSGSPGGVGYERSSGYQNYISLNVQAQMYNGNTSCFVRIPFNVNGNPSQYNFLTLKMRYDDGFVAYINGVEVQRALFTGTPNWNSDADSNHEADGVESFSITDHISALRQGSNILAIHGLNVSTTSSDFLISAELIVGQRSGPTGGSGISPGAVQYSGVITLNNSTHVKARVLRDGLWGALTEATFAIDRLTDNLRISEIMYNPTDPNTEYVELQNIGTETINLNLVKFINGIDFTFPNIELAPNEYVVVVQDREAFETRYGTALNIAGDYSGSLNNGGERIELEDAIGQTILDFDFKDGWRSITDGDGFSLTIIDPVNTEPYGWNEKDSWRASAYLSGSPGEDDSGIVPKPGAVVINEVLAHSHAQAADWIELHNTTSNAIDIGGWFLSDSSSNLAKYQIAQGTIIAPDGYVVFYEDQHFNNPSDPGANRPFALSENGERLYLSSAEGGLLTGYRNVEDFGGSETGVSFGRYYKPSTGSYNFVPMSENTPGFANAYPKVGPIVINEIMYNPSWPVGSSYTNDQFEYIELQNISAEPVALYNYETAQPWKFTDGIDFTFPADVPVTIPAGGYVLVAKDPEAFSWRYPTVPVEKILGPYDGSLNNAGERLQLSMPGDVDESGELYYIRIDRVTYSDGSHPDDSPNGVDHWPTAPDGGGESLARSDSADYGNDSDNWTASAPSPGIPNP
ncbi:MAG: hypothetical protein GY845_00875 [Planctomycetes bacterium]|nr:hypothetical protein [Planctomycetota bacterium]